MPNVLRITRLVSRPTMGPALVSRCMEIAERERTTNPGAYTVVQARRLLDGDRIEVVSLTRWLDLDAMLRYVPPTADPEQPPFYDEYATAVESWSVDLFELTWTTEDGAL